ncbi:MAG: hypothetical protein GY868_02280, partial [Deltaproteobacteria bacterium]|nr:hypothetical protein [Deltaproteobacteria bacterium]
MTDKFNEIDPAGLEIVINQSDIRRDLHRFIDYVSQRGIKRAHRSNAIPKTDLLRLAKIMGHDTGAGDIDFEAFSTWIHAVDKLCLRLRFIKYDTEGVYAGYSSAEPSYPNNFIEINEQRYSAFLDSSLQEQEDEALACLIDAAAPCSNEFFKRGPKGILDRFNTTGCATGVMKIIKFPATRRYLLALLAVACTPGTWCSVKSLIEFIKIDNPHFLIPKKVPAENLYDNNRYGNFRERKKDDPWGRIRLDEKTRNIFERVEGRYVERFLEHVPLTMGYVELAYANESDSLNDPSMGRLRAFRVTDRFLPAARGEIREPQVTVLPNFEVHVDSRFYQAAIMSSLMMFCDIVNEDIHTVLKLSKKKVTATLAADGDMDAIGILRRMTSRPLPANVINELEAWTGQAEAFTVFEGFGLLEGKISDELRGSRLVEQVTPGICIIREPEALFTQLEKAELAPLLINHPDKSPA